MQQAQQKYKALYDHKASQEDYRVGDWVLVRFPLEETGKQRKLSRPWRGPYRAVSRDDPDVKVYHPQEGTIQVYQSCVSPCPAGFPSTYYWYGVRHYSPGRPPKWVQKLLSLSEELGIEEEPVVTDSDSTEGENSTTTSHVGNKATDSKSEGALDHTDEGLHVGRDLTVPPGCVQGRYPLQRHVKGPDRLY